MFKLSCVLILPAALQTAGNALSVALGHGPDTYGVPLCTGETVTHYGAHAWVQQEFIDQIQAAAHGILPAALTVKDEKGHPPITQDNLQAILTKLILSVREGGDSQQHWHEVLQASGLTEPKEEMR